MSPKKLLMEKMQAVLDMAMRERPKRDTLVRVSKTLRTGRVVEETEMAWCAFERETMLSAINVVRQEKGLLPATMRHVEYADMQAAGHSDYARKFALYCTEIALGESYPQP